MHAFELNIATVFDSSSFGHLIGRVRKRATGIAKTDARGRQVDIHALRHTFGTHLSAAGVHPRTAMAAMRHSRIDLTMNFYTDPVLLDVAGAIEALPEFGGSVAGNAPALRSTGTHSR